MKNTKANIEISRKENVLSSISVQMIIWERQANDGTFSIDLPLLGLKTYAFNEDDIDAAVNECVQLFCINSELFGNGIENELKSIGWEIDNQVPGFSSLSFKVSERNSVFDQIIETGEKYSNKLELQC